VDHRNTDLSLICRVRTRLYALPLAHVVETLRPLPVEPLAGAPSFVPGLCVIRGVPRPVVDAARVLGGPALEAPPTDRPAARFVTVRAGAHQVALAVDAVLGVRAVPQDTLHDLPPLLHEAGAEAVAAIGRLDAELLLVLRSSRLLPEDQLQLLAAGACA
jgi:purine-binding chemotaxis protein CheW